MSSLVFIKIVDIMFITVLYFVAGYLVAFALDVGSVALLGGEYHDKSTLVLILEILTQVMFLTVISYLVRNAVQLVPFPWQGLHGFDHMRVKEVSSGGLLTMFSTIFFYDLQSKMLFVRKRVFPALKTEVKTIGVL
jgi:hypothetical protein